MKNSLLFATVVLISSFVSAAFASGVSYYLVQQAKAEWRVLVASLQTDVLPEVAEPAIVVEPFSRATAERVGKDEAWGEWYQVPEQCGLNVSEADFVGCVNHKMRARKEFERVWRQNPGNG